MLNISTILENILKHEKLPVGPTSSRPGPILFSVVVTAVKFVIMSFPSKVIIKSEKQNSSIYVIK